MQALCPHCAGKAKDCQECHGHGYITVSLPEDDETEAIWVKTCTNCEAETGVSFQLKGHRTPKERDKDRPSACPECGSPSEWKKLED